MGSIWVFTIPGKYFYIFMMIELFQSKQYVHMVKKKESEDYVHDIFEK